MTEVLAVPPANLLIDEQNPRISQPNEGQHKALEALAEHLGTKLQALAAHIVSNGLNPSDLSIVMPHPGDSSRYIVLEGNRRLAAIRALENPDSIADVVSKGMLKELRRLGRQYQQDPIDTIQCVEVRDREAARLWIELRHTGENSGAGIVPWGGAETANYRARNGSPTEPHIQALDFLQTVGALSPATRRKVSVTNFERVLTSPAIRQRLGVEIVRGKFSIVGDQKKVTKALMYVVDDMTSGRLPVTRIHTKELRSKYAAEIPATIAVPLPTPNPQPNGESARRGRVKTTRIGKARNRLIPSDCTLEISDQRLRNIAGELKRLSIEDYPNAVAVLFRVFLEISVDCCIEHHPAVGSGLHEPTLQTKLKRVLDELVKRKKLNQQQSKAVQHAFRKDSLLAPSIVLLHEWVHNQHASPSPTDLRAHWDNLQSYVAAVWAHTSAAGQEHD